MRADAKFRLSSSIAVAVFTFIACLCGAQNITAEATADFKWFSGLGFPDVAGCPNVRVATGRWSESDNEPPQDEYIEGFLLMTNGPIFRVLTLDPADETFTNATFGTNEYKRVSYETLDFQRSADSVIESLTKPSSRPDEVAGYSCPLTQTGIFVLGWACWRHGLDAQAAELYDLAQKPPSGRRPDEGTDTFRVLIEKDIAYTMIWHAVVCFDDPSIYRPQLLAMFESIVTNYPDSEYHERAVEISAILRKMIAEDQAHAHVPLTNLDQLPVHARVDELIFRLRDQNEDQFLLPGYPAIFDDWYGTYATTHANTPADQLVGLGYAAVPQLIDALNDPTLTRLVRYGHPFSFSHNVLTVGGCAATILQRITGRSFFFPAYTSSDMSEDRKAAETKKAAEAWWAEFQKKGEKQMLIDELSVPDNDAAAEADILCRKYPDVAVQTLERGIQATTNDRIQSQLIYQLGVVDDPRVPDFLNREMLHSPMLKSRVAAASRLLQLKKGDPIAAMIQEWQRLKGRGFNADDDVGWVLDFLADADSPAAINALGSGIRSCAVDTRLNIVNAVCWLRENPRNSVATWAAIEKLLVNELQDTDEMMGMSGGIDGVNYIDPRVCDMAGIFLAEHWTNRYAFDFSASLKIRDRQRIQCINVWREAHGLPLLPLPAERSHVKPADATTVTDIEWEEGSVRPTDAFARTTAAFMDKPVNASQIVSLLTHYVAFPEPQTSGLEFRAIKDEDLTGVKLQIRLLPGRQLTNSEDFSLDEGVTLGRKGLLCEGGGGDCNYYSMASGWSEFADAVGQALAGKPEVPFEIAVRIKAGNGSE